MSEITNKQVIYIQTNHIDNILHKIGLDVNDLTKEQAIKIIAKHKAKQQTKVKQQSNEKSSSFSSTDFDKLMGRSPDFDRYPGCGYDRSWCG